MTVRDCDLEFMVDVMRGHAEASDCDQSRELAEKVVAELRALRKVADAASALVLLALSGDGDRYQRDMPQYDAIFQALREAGR